MTAHTLGAVPGCYRAGTQPVACGAGHRRPGHFLPVGHQALGSLNLGSQVAARGRTMSPAAKLPESLCRKKKECHRWPPEEKGGWAGGQPGQRPPLSCFLVSCSLGSLSSTENLPSGGVKGLLSHFFPLTSLS